MRSGFGAPARALTTALALVSFVGCKRAASGPGDAGAAIAGLTDEQSSQVLARVGDRTLTVGHYAAALQHMDQFDRMRYQSPERRKELLGEMIDVMLLADEARAQGYDKDAVTQQEMREILRDAMLKKAREGAPAPSDIPEDEVRGYYEAHRADFRDPERRRVSAIVLASAGAASSVLSQARSASAAQWGGLVRDKSVDPLAKGNVPPDLAGDFGFVGPPGDPRGTSARVPDEVRAAVFELANVGDVWGRVVAAGGKFYVVKLASKTDAHDRSLDEASRAIRVRLAQEKIEAKERQLLDQLRQQFPVKVDEPALARVRVELPDAGR